MFYLILFLFLVVYEIAIHARMPFLGHDNAIWFDQLIVGNWHFAHEGLAPFRYSVHLCGGAPVYGDPECLYYSLAQLLSLVIHPWIAMQISVLVAMTVGYLGWFYFSKKVMGMKESWAHLLSLVILANGFFFMHLAVGHFQMHTMPLIGCFLYLLYQREKDSRLSLLTRSAIFALLAAIIINVAGYNVILFSAMLIAFILPFDLLLNDDWKTRARLLIPRFLVSGGLALLISLSRLVAVFSFMRFYPRIEGYAPIWRETNILEFVAKAFWFPFKERKDIPGYGWDLHEKSLFLSPVTWIGLIVGVYLIIEKREWLWKHWKKIAAISIWAIFTTLFFLQLTAGHGFMVDSFLKLPVIRSLRVAPRFLYPFSLLISILSVYALSIYSLSLSERWKLYLPRIGLVLTILSLSTGWYAVRYKLALFENYDKRTEQLRDLSQKNYTHLNVSEVKEGSTDFIQAGTTCHIELLKKSYPIPIHPGAVNEINFDSYNLMNPACYQYPDENNCKPGDRIRIKDQMNFENFTQGLPVTWKISSLQHISDFLSLLTLIFCVAFLIYAGNTTRSRKTTY